MRAPHVDVYLYANKESVRAGEDFKAGVFFKLEKGWHIYWRNPGDSGEAPRIQWNLAPGIEAGIIEWPLPEKIPVEHLTNFGYEKEVLLATTINVSSSYKEAKIPLNAEASWLVCKESCIPGKAKFETLYINVGQTNKDSSHLALFEATYRTLPQKTPREWQLQGSLNSENFNLQIKNINEALLDVDFFANGDELKNASPLQNKVIKKDKNSTDVSFSVARSDRLTEEPSTLSGLLVLKSESSVQSFETTFPTSAVSQIAPLPSNIPDIGIVSALLFAFIGGLILNLMPCVFPVLSIKVLDILKNRNSNKLEIQKAALSYAAGILFSFWVLVAALIALKQSGQAVGWGFQLQSPVFVFVLANILFAMALNLLGVYEISSRLTGIGSSLANKKGLAGSFFTGVLATIVATPCTAPFMGAAMGFALSQNTFVTFLIFTSLALGLAAPYVAISFIPSFSKILPKPGAWMNTFKESMGFILILSVLWLAWVLGQQSNVNTLLLLMLSLLGVSFSAWLLKNTQSKSRISLAIVFAIMSVSLSSQKISINSKVDQKPNNLDAEWDTFSPEKITELQTQGKHIFVDFTAAWCITCQVNKSLVLNTAEFLNKAKEMNVALLKADWTTYDPVITKTLESFGRNGVPFYLIYNKNKERAPVALPELINKDLVLKELEKLK